jgi:hypothetical protein
MNEETLTLAIAAAIFVGAPVVVIGWGIWLTLRRVNDDIEQTFGDARHYDRSLTNVKRANWRDQA